MGSLGTSMLAWANLARSTSCKMVFHWQSHTGSTRFSTHKITGNWVGQKRAMRPIATTGQSLQSFIFDWECRHYYHDLRADAKMEFDVPSVLACSVQRGGCVLVFAQLQRVNAPILHTGIVGGIVFQRTLASSGCTHTLMKKG